MERDKPRPRRKAKPSKPENLVIERILESLIAEKSWKESNNEECRRLEACLRSLRRYPLPIEKDNHLNVLQGFNKQVIWQIGQKRKELAIDGHAKEESEEDEQESSDHQLALRLQERELTPLRKAQNDSSKRNDDSSRLKSTSSQEEEDHQLALRLQNEESKSLTFRSKVSRNDDVGYCDVSVASSQVADDHRLAQRLQAIYAGDQNFLASNLDHNPVVRNAMTASTNSESIKKENSSEDEDEFERFLKNRPTVFEQGNQIIAQHSSQSQITQSQATVAASSVTTASSFSQEVFPNGSSSTADIQGNSINEKTESRDKRRKRRVPSKAKVARSISTPSTATTVFSQSKENDSSDTDCDFDQPSSAPLERSISVSTNGVAAMRSVHNLSSSEDDEDSPTTTQSQPLPKVAKKTAPQSKKSINKKEKSSATRSKKNQKVTIVDSQDQLPSWLSSNDFCSRFQTSQNSNYDINEVRRAFTLEPGTFDVILIVDSSEVSGGPSGGRRRVNSKGDTLKLLSEQQVPCETRSLHVGDFIFVAKPRGQKFGPELVLPYIIERKRLDDLRRSLHDGRYREQKLRLKNSGVKNKIYLVEGYNKHRSKWAKESGLELGLQQAVVSTACSDNFVVQHTDGLTGTVSYLAKMTQILQRKFAFKQLGAVRKEDLEDASVNPDTNLLQFDDFNTSARKHVALNCRQILCHILSFQHGVTWNMAWAITEKYPSLGELMRAFEDNGLDEEESNSLLCDVVYEGRKRIRKDISKAICVLCTRMELK